MEQIVDRDVLIDGHRIAYGIHGKGEPVVFVHGTPSSSYIWRKVLPKLIENDYQAHVFDLLGYGLSERPWDDLDATSITGNAKILEGLLKYWGLDRFHLVAHDIGGGIAQRFAVENTHRLLSLTLIDVVSFDSYPSKHTQEQLKMGLDALARAPETEHREHFAKWLLTTHSRPENFDPEALETYVDFISGPIGQPSFFAHQVAHYDPKHTMEIADRLHELGSIPVQLIWGAEDSWQVTEWAYKLQKAIPHSGLEFIPDCGHFAPEERPIEVADTILAFLPND